MKDEKCVMNKTNQLQIKNKTKKRNLQPSFCMCVKIFHDDFVLRVELVEDSI